VERRTKEVPCPTCGQVWTITKAGAEDFAMMAALCVPSWFKDKTGEERFKARQVRQGMPKEAMWERALDNQCDVAKAIDIMQRCCVKPEIVPNDMPLAPESGQVRRADVAVCCVTCIPPKILDLTSEEAGLTANFPNEAGDGEPGPASTKVRNEPARNDGTQGE